MTRLARPYDTEPRRRQIGFTLAEVLVAMAILSIAIVAGLALMGQHVRAASDVEQRLIAGIVAENILVEGMTETGQLEVSTDRGQVAMGGRNWTWTRATEEAGFPGLYRLKVDVSLEDSEQVLQSVSAFRRAE